jgi:hypothetical protein
MIHYMRSEDFTMMNIYIMVVWVIKSYCNLEGDTTILRNITASIFSRAIVESGRSMAAPFFF